MAIFLVEKSGPLRGEVSISGSKNAVLPIMAAAVMTDEPCELMEVPSLKDVEIMSSLLRGIGAHVEEDYGNRRLSIETENILSCEAPFDLVKRMRASVLVMGALLGRTGKVKVGLPGGCAIGARPIDLHIKGFEALGAKVSQCGEYVEAVAEKLRGANIYLDSPSVGATENIIMAAALAEGITVLENAAEEPEIVDLANFLNKMGARIKGAGTDTVKIEGVEKLKGARHTVIPDRIETGTFMVAAAITRGDLWIKNAVPDHVKPIIAKLKECGATVEYGDEDIRVRGDVNPIVATDIKTLPYPGFPTDIQSPFMALLATAEGASTVLETVFENRFMHVEQLVKMGAAIKTEDRKAIITGGKPLYGAEIRATDLRAGAALVLAGLVAKGPTQLSDIYHIERGYDNFLGKFTKIGAKISKIE